MGVATAQICTSPQAWWTAALPILSLLRLLSLTPAYAGRQYFGSIPGQYLVNTCLLAQLVRCDSIKLPMSLDRDRLVSVCIDGMIDTFAQQVETVYLEVACEVTPLHRHA